MECLSCGECCRTISPINGGRCPLLIEGEISYCSDYKNRPFECKNHDFPTRICPIGIQKLEIKTESDLLDRIKIINEILWKQYY